MERPLPDGSRRVGHEHLIGHGYIFSCQAMSIINIAVFRLTKSSSLHEHLLVHTAPIVSSLRQYHRTIQPFRCLRIQNSLGRYLRIRRPIFRDLTDPIRSRSVHLPKCFPPSNHLVARKTISTLSNSSWICAKTYIGRR